MTTTIMNYISSINIIPHLKNFRNLRVRNRSFNSHDWLKRRESDRYTELAKKKNYRCRSAFKLIQIDDKYKLIKPGFKVLDVGAAPGSWSQVLAERTNANGNDENSPIGLVIAVDLSTFQDIEGVVILDQTDFQKKSSQDKILEILGEGQKFDFVFSDMAPAATGVKILDQENIMNLAYPVILFSVNNLKLGGGCLVKIWEGGESKNIRNDISRFFKYVGVVKPDASYQSSSEIYILAREFLGLKT